MLRDGSAEVQHTPMPDRDGNGRWYPGCSCGWKIRDGWWERKGAEERSLIHAERARAGLRA